MDKKQKEEQFQKIVNEVYETSLKLVNTITKEESFHKRLKHELVMNMFGLMIAEAGNELYPVFGPRELNTVFAYISGCIREMQCEACQEENEVEEDEDDEESDTMNFSEMLKELAEKIAKGDSKVKCIKVKR